MFPFLYPPLLAFVFRPLALLPHSLAYLIWSAISLGLYLGGLVTLLRQVGPLTERGRRTRSFSLPWLSSHSWPKRWLADKSPQLVSSVWPWRSITNSALDHSRQVCASRCAFTSRLSWCSSCPWSWFHADGGCLVRACDWCGPVACRDRGTEAGPSVLMDYVQTTIRFGQLYLGRQWHPAGLEMHVDLRSFTTLLTGQYAHGLAVLCIAACLALPLLVRVWLMS